MKVTHRTQEQHVKDQRSHDKKDVRPGGRAFPAGGPERDGRQQSADQVGNHAEGGAGIRGPGRAVGVQVVVQRREKRLTVGGGDVREFPGARQVIADVGAL